MTLSHLARKAAKAECRFLTRALITAFPIMLLILPLLWLTGYPPEEWPYVSGIFTLSMIGAGTLTGCTTTLAARWAHRYASSVAARLGIEIEQPKDQNPRPGHGRTTRLGARTLRTMASWGLAIHILALVMTQTGMAPIETRFRANHPRNRRRGTDVHHRGTRRARIRHGTPPGNRPPLPGTAPQLDGHRRKDDLKPNRSRRGPRKDPLTGDAPPPAPARRPAPAPGCRREKRSRPASSSPRRWSSG